jgi:hypothetical protein
MLNNHHPQFGPVTTKIPKRNNTQKYRSPPLHSVLAMQNFQLPKTSKQLNVIDDNEKSVKFAY